MALLDNELLTRLSKKCNFEGPEEYLKIAEYFTNLQYHEYSLKDQDINTTLNIIKKLLNIINPEYLLEFQQMLEQEDPNKPVIYFYTSHNPLNLNESLTYYHEIHFYKTYTEADVFLILHEFTHYLINRNNSYSDDKSNNEIAPILVEFIVSELLQNEEYLKHRLNEIIYEAKSIMLKQSIINGDTNLIKLYLRYNCTGEDILKFEHDIVSSKNLKYDEELSYLKGFIYALHFSKNDSIRHYNELVEKLNVNRNIDLPEINSEEIKSLRKK